MYAIEKNVPMPVGRSSYPFADMQIGDSFFVPNAKATTVSVAAHSSKKKLNMKFAVRTVNGGTRVWRVE